VRTGSERNPYRHSRERVKGGAQLPARCAILIHVAFSSHSLVSCFALRIAAVLLPTATRGRLCYPMTWRTRTRTPTRTRSHSHSRTHTRLRLRAAHATYGRRWVLLRKLNTRAAVLLPCRRIHV
jgi:hypothetical protein